MKTTIGQLRQIIREEIRKVSLNQVVNENAGKKLTPINSVKLQNVLNAAVAQKVLEKGDVKYNTKILTNLPALVAKAIGGDDDAWQKVMDGLPIKQFEYNNADDKKLKDYFKKLYSLFYVLDGLMYDGEFDEIPSSWDDVKTHIESFR